MKDTQLVRAVLHEGGYSHARLARALQFRSAKTVARWLSGDCRLQPDTLETLRSLYLTLSNRYGDEDDVKYLHLYAGVYLQPGFDPVKAFRDTYASFADLPIRKRVRIEWAYGNSRFYRGELPAAETAYRCAVEWIAPVEPEWAFELRQNLVGTRLELSKQLPATAPARREALRGALDVCREVIERTPDAIAYVNALEVASQLEEGALCDAYLERLIEVSDGAYADPYHQPNRHSRVLARAEEFRFLRGRECYRRLCVRKSASAAEVLS